MVCKFMLLPNSYGEILIPKDDATSRWGLCEVPEAWGWHPRKWDWCLIKEALERFPSPQLLYEATRSLKPRRRPSPDHACALIADF